MKLNWNSRLSSYVSARLGALLRYDRVGSDEQRTLARAMNALPVYFDFSGALGFTPDGTVLHHDLESRQTTAMTDERWIVIAAVSAAEKYPDLREMLPDKPPTAKTCTLCSGTGRQLEIKAFCGNCAGLGWVS